MKCHNFMCENHDVEYPNNCVGYMFEYQIKKCESRKRYNRIIRVEEFRIGKILVSERDKYHGRD